MQKFYGINTTVLQMFCWTDASHKKTSYNFFQKKFHAHFL